MIKINVQIHSKSWLKEIKNLNQYFKSKLKKIHKKTTFLKNKNITFTILLTNSSNIKILNKKFRGKNKPTDVLSFPFFFKKNLKLSKKKNLYVGDIAISYEIINLRSKKNNFSIEFDKVWIHGLLHLIGFDHIKNKDFLKMSKVEKKILNATI
jgi:probable rRNA maturation factor|tara:strand:- start:83 stop:541 length:459 start_codon:yes stop_codon:yes gene_type:complete